MDVCGLSSPSPSRREPLFFVLTFLSPSPQRPAPLLLPFDHVSSCSSSFDISSTFPRPLLLRSYPFSVLSSWSPRESSRRTTNGSTFHSHRLQTHLQPSRRQPSSNSSQVDTAVETSRCDWSQEGDDNALRWKREGDSSHHRSGQSEGRGGGKEKGARKLTFLRLFTTF